MASKTFFNTPWGERSFPEKMILLVGGSIVTFVAYKKLKQLSGLIKQTGVNIQTGSELGALQTQGVNPNYSATQYSIWADTLQTAMGSWYDGTDEDSIKSVMDKMLNNADVLKLNQAFGTREGYTLSGWLRYELSDSYVDYYVNAPLRNKGITFQF
jgi:hypothetical protein